MTIRRKILITLGTALLGTSICAYAQKQPKQIYRIGFIWPTTESVSQPDIDAIMARLKILGLIQGRDFVAEYRWADGIGSRLADIAAELVRLKVDLIVVRGTPAALAAKGATREIPIVFSMVSDPVKTGIVASLARPQGNMTGWSNMLPETSAKLLQLLREIAPKTQSVAVLWDPTNSGKVLEIAEMKKAAAQLGLKFRPLEVRSTTDVEKALSGMIRDRPDALIALSDTVTNSHRQQIVNFATKYRLPAIYQIREYVDAGGLMSYGMNVLSQHERTAEYVMRIIKGTKPADLPVEQPTRFELIINGKTAKSLGLTIPPALTISANRIIE